MEKQKRPCPCGRSALAVWPWVVHTPQLGFCDFREEGCGMAAWELTCWRSEWIEAFEASIDPEERRRKRERSGWKRSEKKMV